MSEAIAQKLDEARALIEKGWTKGWFISQPAANGEICYCLYGALNQVVVGDPEADTTEADEYAKWIAQVVGVNFTSLADWNDRPERTQAEVIEAFKRAADLARSEAAAVGGR